MHWAALTTRKNTYFYSFAWMLLVNIPRLQNVSIVRWIIVPESTRQGFLFHNTKKPDINACIYNLSGPPDHMTSHFFSHRTATVCTLYPDIITLNANQFPCLSINRSSSIESSRLSLSATMTNLPCIWLRRHVFLNTVHIILIE